MLTKPKEILKPRKQLSINEQSKVEKQATQLQLPAQKKVYNLPSFSVISFPRHHKAYKHKI